MSKLFVSFWWKSDLSTKRQLEIKEFLESLPEEQQEMIEEYVQEKRDEARWDEAEIHL